MQECSLSVGRVPSYKTKEILKGGYWAFTGPGSPIARHVLPSEYVWVTVFVRKCSSNSPESVVVYVASEVSIAGDEDATCSVEQHH